MDYHVVFLLQLSIPKRDNLKAGGNDNLLPLIGLVFRRIRKDFLEVVFAMDFS
jgi:hypothetical protein